MKLFKVLLIPAVIVSFFILCSPPPDIPEKEEVIKDTKFKGDYTKNDIEYFLSFFNEMRDSVKNRDAEKSFSFYSKDFMSDSGVNLEDLKKNTTQLYKVYNKIIYEMSDVKVHVKDDKAVTVDNYIYKATPIMKGYKLLNYSGKERIYWQKEKGKWKITNWVYE